MTGFASTSPRASRERRRLGFVLAAALALAPVPDLAAQVTYAGALRMATGTYLFSDRTNTVSVMSAVQLETGPLQLSAGVPLITQSTPWVSYLAVPVPSGGRQAGLVAEQIRRGAGKGTGSGAGPGGSAAGSSTVAVVLPAGSSLTGVGDPIVRAGFRLTSAVSSTVVRLQAAFKPGLASVDDGFGTGASDVAAGVTVAHLVGRQQFSAAFEVWRLGDMADLPLNNASSYRVEYDLYTESQQWSFAGAFSGWTSIIDDVDPPRDVSVGVARHFDGTRRSVGATASFGLTDSSPDVAVSLDWRLQF